MERGERGRKGNGEGEGDGIRIAKNKSQLKKSLRSRSEVSSRNAGKTDVMVIDCSALLWVIHLPEAGTVNDYVFNGKERLQKLLKDYEVYLVFDGYRDFSLELGVTEKPKLPVTSTI